MKVLVCAKRVVDYTIQVRPNRDETGIDTANIKMSLNPFDEIALEQAVQMKEQGEVNEIVVVSIGDHSCEETLRHALAMGADEAILIESDAVLGPFNIAKILQSVVMSESPDFVLMGKQAIDDDCNQTGQLLAGFLNWSQATFVSSLAIQGNLVSVAREVDEGLEKLTVALPAVMTVDLRLNEPRYISLPNIMKAKQKPLRQINIDECQVDIESHIEIVKMTAPPQRQAGVKLESFSELMDVLQNKENVL